MIHEKTGSKKSCDTVPLHPVFVSRSYSTYQAEQQAIDNINNLTVFISVFTCTIIAACGQGK
jgi:hypothetical protein